MTNSNGTKFWFKSKTLWFNIVSTLIFGVEQFVGSGHINPEQAVFIVTIINLILRFVTEKRLEV
jgi:hypothetical protein